MANNLVFIVMDSCRWDSVARAKTPNMDRIGKAERRFSYASWTSPSHQTLLMGQMPHTSPRGVFASEVYKKEFSRWIERLGVPGMSFKSFVPQLCLAKVLKDQGYRCTARVSMPVLNPFAGFNRGFDDYKLMTDHNDFAGMVREIGFSDTQPSFWFLNLGETHYPYMLGDITLPRISGVHGVVSGMDELLTRSSDQPDEPQGFFPPEEMARFHDQQVACVEYVDRLLGELQAKCPPNTWFIVTADHGELFGEGGYFGHGPIMHEKAFEVPFLEGMVR
ncbi:MAG: sulfatase-like hydrolase/transferase [Alphaproteobacteria bacterium]|nr:sulfatase-like hydrolase/transferase [Alphaproteobacteria bacterium]